MNIKKSYIQKVNAIRLGGSLSIILAGSTGLVLQSCNSASDEADYEVEEKYTQGVKTFIKETEPGKFKITDEETVAADSSKAIVTYLDGRVEELNKEQSKALIDKEISNNGSQVGQGFGLGNALLYGGMGYFLARTLSPGYGRYRPEYRDNNRGSGGSAATSAAASRRYYTNDAAYTRANTATASMAKSRTFTSRPSASRGGFFGGRSSRGGGFGG